VLVEFEEPLGRLARRLISSTLSPGCSSATRSARKIRIGELVANGYRREDFEDSWSR
jgi:hypothetical protein